MDFEDIKKYLPQYLSKDSSHRLFEDLKQFPKNIEKRLYTEKLKNEKIIFQGDALEGFLFINIDKLIKEPQSAIQNCKKIAPGIVLSNTCDIDPTNKRISETRILYAPIINLKKYENLLIKKFVNTNKKSKEAIKQHITEIKNNIYQIYFIYQSMEN